MRRATHSSFVLLTALVCTALATGCGQRPARGGGGRSGREARRMGRNGGGGPARGRAGRGRAGVRPTSTAQSARRPKPPAGAYDGGWKGTTSEGKQITFTIEANVVRRCFTRFPTKKGLINVQMKWGPRSGGRPAVVGGEFAGASPFSPSTLSGEPGGPSDSTGRSADLFFSGRFTSKTTATGTLRIQESGTRKLLKDLSWKASRNPRPPTPLGDQDEEAGTLVIFPKSK